MEPLLVEVVIGESVLGGDVPGGAALVEDGIVLDASCAGPLVLLQAARAIATITTTIGARAPTGQGSRQKGTESPGSSGEAVWPSGS